MAVINIITHSKSYPVIIGHNVINQLSDFLTNNLCEISKIMIVTDENVGNLYLPTLTKILANHNICTFITPAGEAAKTFDIYYEVMTFALENKLDRNAIVLAFGGGAIGDLGGFIAATYMRGIPFIQIPTTILAHDSAVGGKVAINHPIGKNMIGAFYQPEAVFYDLEFLDSLPIKEKRSGFAELIKHALIKDSIFYKQLINHIQSLEEIHSHDLLPLLSEGIKVKAEVVGNDEREIGQRAFLNFGHTLGHAIEAESGYGNMSHGEAVVIGMVCALKLSMIRLNLSFDLPAFKNWLNKLGYITHIPEELSKTRLVDRMTQDKKAIKGDIRMVLLSEIGRPVMEKVSKEEILGVISTM